jgi:hypothetical protein
VAGLIIASTALGVLAAALFTGSGTLLIAGVLLAAAAFRARW